MSYKIGLLCTRQSLNLGDQIQIAVIKKVLHRLGKSIDYYVERDTHNIYDLRGNQIINYVGPPIRVVYAGWFDGNVANPNIPDYIKPIFVGIHMVDEPSNDLRWLERFRRPFESWADPARIEYYNQTGMIGCRENKTFERLFVKGFREIYVNHSTTLALRDLTVRVPDGERRGILAVDADMNVLQANFPGWTFSRNINDMDNEKTIILLTHLTDISLMERCQIKQRLAEDLIELYRKAKLVITNRTQAVLASIAMNTPTMFVSGPDAQTPQSWSVLFGGIKILGVDELDLDHLEKVNENFDDTYISHKSKQTIFRIESFYSDESV